MDTSQVVGPGRRRARAGLNVQRSPPGRADRPACQPRPTRRRTGGIVAGDVITAVDGHTVRTRAQLTSMRGSPPGSVRATPPATRSAATGTSRPAPSRAAGQAAARSSASAIGDAVRIGRIPVHVHYSISGIGGPSAGLAFALEIYDSLSGRHLLHGHKVAVTGELELNGDVHRRSAASSRRRSARSRPAPTRSSCPRAEHYRRRARRAAGKMRVIGVTTFDQALRAIRQPRPRTSDGAVIAFSRS